MQTQLDSATVEFYRSAMRALDAAGIPFLVGGAYAFERYTGIARHSKDLDLFVRKSDVERALVALREIGCHTEIRFAHWLAKAWQGAEFVDLIHSSGNGVAIVDEDWFDHAMPFEVLGVEAWVIPAEEMIWSKAFIMERERFDGADVAHVLHARAEALDWDRLLARFGSHWRVLFAHLVMFGFVYPGERSRIPDWVLRELSDRLEEEVDAGDTADGRLCQGTLISRQQYLPDLAGGYEDVRSHEHRMTEEEITVWTAGIAVDGYGGAP